ncbi:hypothetical protein [Stenotrophomonas maltophilia]|uniref:hypothetical protein n=1 Tax=Stenotrophomonas maltophilia TaxID=40324 RepID=UPI002A9657D5|nr:hypothetical protein [Stenotrophomonas maltophilia]
MTTPAYPFLHATLGDACATLPEALATRIEEALSVAGEEPTPPALSFLAELRRIRAVDAANGQPWPETELPPGRRMALARADRAASGLTLLLECLHAVERTRQGGGPDQQLGDNVVDGLLLACRGLSEHVEAQLRPG